MLLPNTMKHLLLIGACLLGSLEAFRLGEKTKNQACPGSPVCMGHGTCEQGTCWCDTGFGGPDCSLEVPLFLDVTEASHPDPKYADSIGRYRADGMYLIEPPGPASSVKFVMYDPVNGRWQLSKFNSSCIDDACLSAYGEGEKYPPQKGYVFSGDMTNVYYKQLVFDDNDLDHTKRRGTFVSVSYTTDPRATGAPDFSEFNGRYVLQPRYTHMTNGKYSIFPLDFTSPGKTWVLATLTGQPRKWEILSRQVDNTEKRYYPPLDWAPFFQAKYACANHVGDLACLQVADQCTSGSKDTQWVQQCCRDTCGTCSLPRMSCPLPHVNSVVALKLAASKLSKVKLEK